MNKIISRLFLALFISACLAGCMTQATITGRDFDASKIAKIDKEFTTSDELVALLGQPNRTWVWSEKGTMWEYSWQMETNRTRLGWTRAC
jgi:outer membrane protein assembly factor BamE (lipoprotein component of BamABCDE complex)